jgi:hypothetical protein
MRTIIIFATKLTNRVFLNCAALSASGLFSFSAQAVDPPPDGGYPFQNTAEGEGALFNFLIAGYYGNVAVGYHALYTCDRGMIILLSVTRRSPACMD